MSKHRAKKRRSRFRNRPSPDQHRVLLADAEAAPTVWSVMAYGPQGFVEKQSPTLDDVMALRAKFPVVWLDVAGLANVEFIQEIGNRFAIHPLVLEDIVRTHQRPKLEDYPDALFLIARMAPTQGQEFTEQLALYLTASCLITFQEYPGDDFESIRNRIRNCRGRICSQGNDYLTYAILDATIDAYFPLVDQYGEAVENLEDNLVLSPGKTLLSDIYTIRRKILELRRSMWPQREMLVNLYRGDSPLINESTLVFLRDCYDHSVQLIDIMENYRELASNLMEVYLSSVSNRLNEIMKVLTIISVIFIPLTFIVGVYGMNFNTSSPWNMPELNARFGYPVCIGLMLMIAAGQLYYFGRKGWLRSDDRELPEETVRREFDNKSNVSSN